MQTSEQGDGTNGREEFENEMLLGMLSANGAPSVK